ncbi:MAG: helix-turn-helix transcriptional regulator [Rhodoferax sp.]|nr:helix-turn-helix transcriptional regulator [Rhodoferax sp.]
MGNANLQKNLAGKVKHLRTLAGISQDNLAQRCGLPTGQIARIEEGAANPTLAAIQALAYALDVSPAALFDDQPLD